MMLKKGFDSAFGFLFPKQCLLCEAAVLQIGLCGACSRELDPLDDLACVSCGMWTEDGRWCQKCRQRPSALKGVSALFSYDGAAGELVKLLKYGNHKYLAKALAAFMITHWLELGWSKPDLVTYVPMNWIRNLGRGFNQSQLLAKEFAKGLDLCFARCLHKRMGQTPQTALSYQQRQIFGKQEYIPVLPHRFVGKSILVIDDVSTTGATLKDCAARLHEAGAGEIRALTFCRVCHP